MKKLVCLFIASLLHISMALASTFHLSVEVTPDVAGTLNNDGGDYEENSSIYLSTSRRTGYVFLGWYEDDALLSTSTGFYYTMPARDALVQARYEYNPSVPDNPSMPDTATYYTLTTSLSPIGAGSINHEKGQYTAGYQVYLSASKNTGFQFEGWKNEQDEVVSTSSSFYYTMPSRDTHLTAKYTYNPSTPANPDTVVPEYQVTITAEPTYAGSFNTSSTMVEKGGSVYLYAYTNTGFVFKYWKNPAGDTLSTEQNFSYSVPKYDSQVIGVFEYDPTLPSNPNKNYWNPQTGEVIADEFSAGSLYSAISEAIKGSDRSEVSMITVAGRINSNDFGIANNFTNCTLFDFSRVAGVATIPSYAFDGTNIETIYLPSTIETIGYRAFEGCANLSSITCYATTPPVVESYVFKDIPTGLVVYVPSSVIPQYQEAEVWKDFTILPIQDDIRSITVNLPKGTNTADYKQLWLELINVKSGQRIHYIMTERSVYTFYNLIHHTTWNIQLRNEAGDVFGAIENVEVADNDTTVTFASLQKPQTVALSVLEPNGTDVTNQVVITWTDEKGVYVAKLPHLNMQKEGKKLNYQIQLPQELATQYALPQTTEYIVEANNNIVKYTLQPLTSTTITGKVVDAKTQKAIEKASVVASLTFANQYTQTISAQTNKQGEYQLSIPKVPTTLTFEAAEHISQTINCDSLVLASKDMLHIDDIQLKTITGVVLSLKLTYTSSVVEGETAETQNWYADYNNVQYTLYNITKQRAITQFNVQYPQIVLLEEVEDKDELLITATSKNNSFIPVESHVVVTEQAANATFNIYELGKIQATFAQSENNQSVGLLYDSNGELIKSYAYNSAQQLTTDKLSDTTYTLVSMGYHQLLNAIYSIGQLSQIGLVEGVDYTKNTIQVQSGKIAAISISTIPTLDDSKLNYTDENTSFTVNKPSIVAGNYLTLTGKVNFKPEFASEVSNVQLLFDIPESCSFVENSVMVGNSVSNYVLEGSRLTIPVQRHTDRVRFCVIPTRGGQYAPSAFVQFDLGQETIVQPIGSTSYEVQDLSIVVPMQTNKQTISIHGTAIARSKVEIFDNDTKIAETTVLSNGDWKVDCNLHEPYNLSIHAIHAKVTTPGGLDLQSETLECKYDINAILVKTVVMSYRGSQVVFDFENNKTSTNSYSFVSTGEFTFIADFTNNDTTLVSDVRIYVFTNSNDVVELPASYDAKTDKWVAVGTFDSKNLPVNVSVDYVAKTTLVLDADELYYSRDQLEEFIEYHNQILQRLKEAQNDTTGEKMDQLVQELMIEMTDSTDSEITAFNQMLDNMTEEEFDAYSDVLDAEISAFLLENQELLDNVSVPINLAQTCDIQTEDGARMLMFSDSAYIGKDLLSEGYNAIPLTNDTVVYYMETDSMCRMIDFTTHTVVEIYYSEEATNPNISESERVAYKARDIQILIRNAILAIDETIGTIGDFYKDLTLRLKQTDTDLQKSGKKISAEFNKALNYFNKSKHPLKRAFWFSKMMSIETLKISNFLALKAVKLCGPLLRKVIPVLEYIDLANKLTVDIRTVGDLYLSIPEPCPDDQTDADLYAAQCLTIIPVFAAYAYTKLATRVQADFTIASSVIAALPTGGTSLIGTIVGIAERVLTDILLDKAYEITRDGIINDLSMKIQSLECYKEKPTPSPPSPLTPPLRPIIDPSGYVYEAVSSNRLEGVIATCYYKETVEDMYGDLHENIVKWNAEEYAQENPLFTDENGMYRWDVPQGLWQVKFEKEGYETTYSDWLPVPPPQLEVNIAMKQNVQPNVQAVRAYEDAIEIQFDKYMLPELLTTDNIIVMSDTSIIAGSIQLMNEEIAYEGLTDKYVSHIRFNAVDTFATEEITLLVKNRIKSYAGIRMQDDFTQSFTIQQEIKNIVCDSLITVIYGEEKNINVQVLPASAAAGKTLHVKSSSPMLLQADTTIVLNQEGKAVITLSGELPGSTSIQLTVEDSDISASSIVKIVDRSNFIVTMPIASIESGSTIQEGTTIALSCETENAVIYYTTDGSCPCDTTLSSVQYNGQPIVINQNTTLKAIAYVDAYESEIATFYYTVLLNPVDTTICANESVLWNGVEYASTGIYVDTLDTGIATLHLTTLPEAIVESEELAICPSELPYNWHGIEIKEEGNYTASIQFSSTDCDSVIYNLAVIVQDEYNLVINSEDTLKGNISVGAWPTCPENIAEFEAIPNEGYLFSHWSDGNQENPRTLVLTQDTIVTAIFKGNIVDCDSITSILSLGTWDNQIRPTDDWYEIYCAEAKENGQEYRMIIINSSSENITLSLDAYDSCEATQTAFSYAMNLAPEEVKVLPFDCSSFDMSCYLHAVSTGDVLIEMVPTDCGENLYWDYQEGHLSISGFGDMYDYVFFFKTAPWSSLPIEQISLPATITSIGNWAFFMNNISSIDIPVSVTKIGDAAFGFSADLQSITIPEAVSHIGIFAFIGCYNMNSIMIDESNTNFDSRDNSNAIIYTAADSLIVGCKTTIIPKNITKIGVGAFSAGMDFLDDTIIIPEYLDTMHLAIHIPNSVKEIAEGAFMYSYFDTLYMESLTPPIIDTTTFNTNPICFVPCGALNAYQHSDWATYMESIEEYTQTQYAEETVTACDSYTWNGETYTQSGDYTYTTTASNGCDSIVTLHLTINNSEIGETERATICYGETYTWNGQTYSTEGEYSVALTNSLGCDSVATLQLTIMPEAITTTETVVVGSDEVPYTWRGQSINATGRYTDIEQYTTVACDSAIHVLDLTVLTTGNYDEQSVTICETEAPYLWYGESYSATGKYTYIEKYVGTDIDSIQHILNLTVNPTVYTEETVVACDSYTWNGETYTASGDYTYTTTATNGCDSIVTLHLTINETQYTEATVVACDSYTWNGETYTESGEYVYTTTATNGCDSIVTLHLTINQTQYVEETVVACDSYTWNGQTYATTGAYTYTTTAANGCDSIVTLHLTINNTQYAEETVVACDSYTWNGETYIESGDYVYTIIATCGCDSIVTLHLTINKSEREEYTAVACDEYVWNGVTYTESGDYTYNTITAAGCERVEVLHLTINKSEHVEFTEIACDSYVWNGVTYTESGDYTYNTTTAAGCERLEVLHLTINKSEYVEFTETACDEYVWNGVTYTESGDYTYNTITAAGCERLEVLHLTILPEAVTESEELALCPSELPYEWYGQSITEAGTYSVTEPYTGMECDSVIHEVTVNVYVHTLPATVTQPIVRTGEAIDVTIPTAEIQAHIAAETWYAPNAEVAWYIMENSDWATLTTEPVAAGTTQVTLKYAVETDCGNVESEDMVIDVIPTSVENTNNQSPISNCQKVLYEDHIYILRDGKTYTIMGVEIK